MCFSAGLAVTCMPAKSTCTRSKARWQVSVLGSLYCCRARSRKEGGAANPIVRRLVGGGAEKSERIQEKRHLLLKTQAPAIEGHLFPKNEARRMLNFFYPTLPSAHQAPCRSRSARWLQGPMEETHLINGAVLRSRNRSAPSLPQGEKPHTQKIGDKIYNKKKSLSGRFPAAPFNCST